MNTPSEILSSLPAYGINGESKAPANGTTGQGSLFADTLEQRSGKTEAGIGLNAGSALAPQRAQLTLLPSNEEYQPVLLIPLETEALTTSNATHSTIAKQAQFAIPPSTEDNFSILLVKPGAGYVVTSPTAYPAIPEEFQLTAPLDAEDYYPILLIPPETEALTTSNATHSTIAKQAQFAIPPNAEDNFPIFLVKPETGGLATRHTIHPANQNLKPPTGPINTAIQVERSTGAAGLDLSEAASPSTAETKTAAKELPAITPVHGNTRLSSDSIPTTSRTPDTSIGTVSSVQEVSLDPSQSTSTLNSITPVAAVGNALRPGRSTAGVAVGSTPSSGAAPGHSQHASPEDLAATSAIATPINESEPATLRIPQAEAISTPELTAQAQVNPDTTSAQLNEANVVTAIGPAQTANSAPALLAATPGQVSPLPAKPADIPTIVSESISKADPGNNKLVVQLDPPELGRVTIDFRFEGTMLQAVTVTGETPEALRQLRQLHFELIQALEQNGLASGDLDFRQEQHPQHSLNRGLGDAPENTENSETLSSSHWAMQDRIPTNKRADTQSGLDIKA